MGSSLLDELPCLLDEADELIARLSFFLKLVFTPPPPNRAHPSDPDHDPYVLRQRIAGVNIDYIARSFCKHLLMAPTATASLAEKLDALLPPPESESFRALQALAARIFHLMKRLYQWQQTTWDETLMPFFVADSNQLTFDRHCLLTSLVLTGITKSVKLHLLWSSYPNLSGLLVLHSYLDGKKKTKDSGASNLTTADQEIYRPLDFVLYFGSNPLIKIQQELQQHPLAHNVARNMLELVLSCFDCFVGCHDLAQLKSGGHLFEIDAAVVHGTYASSSIYQDLLVLPQLVEWVLCVALCLPHQLKSEPIRNSSWQLWDFVQLIAQDRLVIVVSRDLVVNLHDLLYQQLVSALSSASTTASTCSSTLQPLKKILTRLSKRAVQCAGELRRERRALVVWFLRDCVKLLRQNGAIAAPLLPRFLAVASLAQDELQWMLAHSSSSALLPTHVKSKHLDRSAKSYKIDPTVLTELLSEYQDLRSRLTDEVDCVRRYYTQFISRGDADGIAREIQRSLAQSEALHDDHVVAMLQSFTDRRRFQLAAGDAGFGSWRRQWQQLSVHLLLHPAPDGSSSVPPGVANLLDRACRHANYVQAYETLLQRATSLSACFWFQEALDRCGRDIMKTDTSNANVAIILAVSSDLAMGQAAIDELVEASEAAHEVAGLGRRIELQKIAIGEFLQRAIDGFLDQEEKLHERLNPEQMIDRLVSSKQSFQNGVSSSAKTAEKAATTMLLLTPGTESRLLSVPDAAVLTAQPLAAARSHLRSIVAGLDRYLTVEQDLVGLRELVASSVQCCIRRFLRGLVHEHGGGHGERKFSLRVPWADAARQWRGLRRCVREQFRSSKWKNVSELVDSVLDDECRVGTGSSHLMDRVLGFYRIMLETKCGTTKSHASLLVCLSTSSYILHRPSASDMDPAAYASAPAFAHLREIIGRDAFHLLRDQAESYVSSHTRALFAALETDKIALIRLKLAFPEDQGEIQMAVRIMEALDKGLVRELLCVGNGVFFLQVLDGNSTSTSRLHQQLRALWGDALPPHVQTIWNLLPWVLVAAFHAGVWAKTKYLAEVDATSSNVHLLAPATRLLVEAFGSEKDVALLASQAVLSLRRVSSELPSPAMLAVAQQLTCRLSTPDWLPDFIQRISAQGA